MEYFSIKSKRRIDEHRQKYFALIKLLRARKKARWRICRSLQTKVYLVKHRSWAKSKSPLLFIADISLELFASTSTLGRPVGEQIFPELCSLLQAMIELPEGYAYIWAEHWEDDNIRGPGTLLWRTVERLASLCLANPIYPKYCFSDDEFIQLVARMLAKYRSEKEQDAAIVRSYKGHVRRLAKRKGSGCGN